ncbi:MAG TPA: NF038122 family metalloprotease, partial [Pyrinomonadaceae bacterium]|nr:NF038122 family metalloprotease [Pyrinomonadaceae bacterium]
MLQFPLGFSPRYRTTSHRDFKPFRKLIVLGLVALLFFAPLGFRVSAQQQSSTTSKPQQGNQFTIYQDASGNVVCREATLLERAQAGNVDTESLGLRQINHLEYQKGDRATKAVPGENSGTGLTIILRATSQLQANPTAVAAFNRAAQNWENIILSPVTIYIDVDYGTTNFGRAWGSGVLGSTSAPSNAYPYQSVRTNLVAEASGEGNTTKQANFNALPQTTVPSDLGDKSSTVVSDSLARALGLLPATAQSTDSAARIAFNSNFSFDFNPDDGITAGQTDFDAVATHEIGHALGFHSEAGATARPSVWDLYRFRTGTTSSTFTTAQRILTIGGSPDPLQYYFVPGNSELGLSTGGPSGVTTNGGDGWQSSHWKHLSGCSSGSYIGIMDPAISSGCRRTITGNDVLALTSFGYNLTNSAPPPPPPPTPTPPANDNFANAQTIIGCSSSVAGTSIGATSEAGEPSHDPTDTSSNSPGHTVWYQWQAPSSSSVTITTEGSEFDTILAIYTGTSVNSLTRALKPDGSPAFNDDVQDGVITTSSVTFNATAGTVYKIAVDGWGGDSGAIKLNWTESNCTGITTPTITWNNPADIIYGTALSGTQLNATANTPGTFTYNPPAGTILNAGSNQTLSVNFTPNDTTNFTSASKSVQINVLQGSATVSISNVTFTYDGTPKIPTVTTTPAGLNVTVTYNGSTTPPINAGSYQVLASVNDSNYLPSSRLGILTINRATPTITWSNPSDITYGTGLVSAQLNATASVAGTFTYTPGLGTVLNAGSNQTLSVNFTPTDTSNYNSASKSVSINILKANQTINFDLIPSKTFGDAPFSLNATTLSGLPISFQILSGPATISGNTVTINGTGTVMVRASQSGSSNYNAAT